MHCFNSLIRPLKFNKRHLTANSQDVRVLIEIWGTPERGVMLNCKRLPRPVIWGLGRTCQQGWCDSSSTSKRELPRATKAFSSVLRHVTSLTFYSFLGFLFPHLFVISTVRRGGEIPKGNECVGQQANLPRALCRCARVQHPCSYRKPEHKPGERDSHPQSKNNKNCNLPEPLGIFGQKVWVSVENRSALSTSQAVTVLLQLQGAKDTSKARFAM